LISITIDEETGAIYVRVSDEPIATTDRYSEVVHGDFDAAGQLVGVEILPSK
jgi:hypothetical protein